jgi:hypothetical protein
MENQSMSDLPKTPNWDIPMDPHFGEIGRDRIPDDMDDDDIDEEEEELPISDDVIESLGFNPEEYDENEEDGEEYGEEEK